MRWRRGGDSPVLTSVGGTAGPGQDADVQCSNFRQLQDAVQSGAHAVWVGHPDLMPVVGDGVYVTCQASARLVARGEARVWARERGYVMAMDDVVVDAVDEAGLWVSGAASVTARGRAHVELAGRGATSPPGSDQPARPSNVRVTLSEGATAEGMPDCTRVVARGSAHVSITGLQAQVEVDLDDDATAHVGGGPASTVLVRARGRSMVDASGLPVLELKDDVRVLIGWTPEYPDLPTVRTTGSGVRVAAERARWDDLVRTVGSQLTTDALVDDADLASLGAWTAFFGLTPTANRTVRLYLRTSTAPGHEGALLDISNDPRERRPEAVRPGSRLPVGTRVFSAWTRPLGAGGGRYDVVAVDVPLDDISPRRGLLGAASVLTSVPLLVTGVAWLHRGEGGRG